MFRCNLEILLDALQSVGSQKHKSIWKSITTYYNKKASENIKTKRRNKTQESIQTKVYRIANKSDLKPGKELEIKKWMDLRRNNLTTGR